MADKTDYTNVSDVAISDEKRERLYEAQTAVATSPNHPTGGKWSTCSEF